MVPISYIACIELFILKKHLEKRIRTYCNNMHISIVAFGCEFVNINQPVFSTICRNPVIFSNIGIIGEGFVLDTGQLFGQRPVCVMKEKRYDICQEEAIICISEKTADGRDGTRTA